MNKITKNSVFCLALVLLLGGCTSTRDVQVLQSQVRNQQDTIQSLNAQLSGVQPAQADTWMQLQTLRQEMSAMRGTLDTIEMALKQVGGSQNLAERFAKQERALRLVETQLGMNLQLDDVIDLAGLAAVATPSTGISSPSVSQGSQGTQGQTQVTAPTTPTPPAKPVPTQTVNTDTAQALYDNGMKAFNERRYPQALNAFTDFVNTYPKNSLISNAIFWQGECQYQLNNFAAAALAYENVISKYPNSNKAPAAYLKQGMSFAKLGKKDAAKERYNQLTTKYPKAPEATRAGQLIKEL